MGTFTTKLKLNSKAFGVFGDFDPTIIQLTVGQIRITETSPSARNKICKEESLYKEEYMCFETGIGSGSIWTYGKNIFATEEEAKKGALVIKQKNYEQLRGREERRKEREEWEKQEELKQLKILKEKYEMATD